MSYKSDRDAFLKEVKFVSDPIRMAKMNAEHWLAEHSRRIGEDTIQYDAFDDEARAEFDTWERYPDNVAYQRDNLKKSCENIGRLYDLTSLLATPFRRATSLHQHSWDNTQRLL